jgi:hypothetical protein
VPPGFVATVPQCVLFGPVCGSARFVRASELAQRLCFGYHKLATAAFTSRVRTFVSYRSGYALDISISILKNPLKYKTP